MQPQERAQETHERENQRVPCGVGGVTLRRNPSPALTKRSQLVSKSHRGQLGWGGNGGAEEELKVEKQEGQVSCGLGQAL